MKSDVHIERIYPDEDFWLTNVAKAKEFFQTSLLPELLGNFIPMTPFINIAKVQSYCYHKNLLAVEHQFQQYDPTESAISKP